jgi:hypothetical protein
VALTRTTMPSNTPEPCLQCPEGEPPLGSAMQRSQPPARAWTSARPRTQGRADFRWTDEHWLAEDGPQVPTSRMPVAQGRARPRSHGPLPVIAGGPAEATVAARAGVRARSCLAALHPVVFAEVTGPLLHPPAHARLADDEHRPDPAAVQTMEHSAESLAEGEVNRRRLHSEPERARMRLALRPGGGRGFPSVCRPRTACTIRVMTRRRKDEH